MPPPFPKPTKARPKPTKVSKSAQHKLWLAEQASPSGEPPYVDIESWEALREQLAPVSDSYLRKLLRESGAALGPLVEGVRQENFDQLAQSLIALAEIYEQGRHAETRKLVIQAKDHARFATARAGDDRRKHDEKEEMVAWMITWLENPAIFPQWVALRMRSLDRTDEANTNETAGA